MLVHQHGMDASAWRGLGASSIKAAARIGVGVGRRKGSGGVRICLRVVSVRCVGRFEQRQGGLEIRRGRFWRTSGAANNNNNAGGIKSSAALKTNMVAAAWRRNGR